MTTHKRPTHGQRDRARLMVLIAAQGNLCARCGEPMQYAEVGFHHPRRATTDHVIPRIAGGPDRRGNVVAMHRLCNTLKGNRLPTGCECIWLLAVNARIGQGPASW